MSDKKAMKICIAGSLNKSKDAIDQVYKWIKQTFLGVVVVTPHKELCIEQAQDKYAKDLVDCGLLIAIPKEVWYTNDGLRYCFGESTHYEMAFAEAQGVPVMVWTKGIERGWYESSELEEDDPGTVTLEEIKKMVEEGEVLPNPPTHPAPKSFA